MFGLALAMSVTGAGCIAPLEPHPALTTLYWTPPAGTDTAREKTCASGMAAGLIAHQIHAPVRQVSAPDRYTADAEAEHVPPPALRRSSHADLSIRFRRPSRALITLRDRPSGRTLWQSTQAVSYQPSAPTCQALVEKTIQALRRDHIVLGTDPLAPARRGPASGGGGAASDGIGP